MAKNTIILHLDWAAFLDRLTDQQLGQWTRAVMRYMADETLPTGLDPAVDVAFYAAFERMGRDLRSYERRTRNLLQNKQGEKQAAAPEPARIGIDTGGVPVPVPVPDPVPKPIPVSSSDDSGKAVTTMIPQDLMQRLTDAFGPPTPYIAARLLHVVPPLGDELANAILDKCLQNNARNFSYFLTAANNALGQGVKTVANYNASKPFAGGWRDTVPTRAVPDGLTNPLADPARKRKLKRSD